MEKLTQSVENLKSIYLEEVQKEFSSDLNEEFLKNDCKGFDKVKYWKLVAEKFIFVTQRKNPEMSSVISVIIQEILDIIESGKKVLFEEWESEKVKLIAQNEESKKELEKSKKIIERLEEKIKELEKIKEDSEAEFKEQPEPNQAGALDFDPGLLSELKTQLKDSEKEIKSLKNKLETFESAKDAIQKLEQENQNLLFLKSELEVELELLKKPAKLTPKQSLSQAPVLVPKLVPALKPVLVKKEPPKEVKKNLIKPRATTHDLTIRQLKDTIEEIYSLKQKFDEKCRDSHQARETMDQFLYTYLNQKYGLKSLISEWSVLILRAIDKHESSDSEVSLFKKTLNHQIDEDYRQTFEKLKENMKQFLKAKIQQRNPYMREPQINLELKEKLNGILDEDEWGTIIVSMFSQEESEFMIGNFKTFLEKNIGKLILSRKLRGQVNKTDASFSELQNFILSYDLSAREALLHPFYQVFTEEDFDKNGMLSADEFRNLCIKLGVDNDFPRLLIQVDPYSSSQINFSDCVSLFSYELVALENESPISVIHYLFFQGKS